MNDSKYSYSKVNAIKVIVENSKGEILLIQEPVTNEWMPGHWGLPGGKPLVKESLHQAFKRKMNEELSADIEPKGIFRVEELLDDKETAFIFVVVALPGSEKGIEAKEGNYKWVGVGEVKEMSVTEFAGFYDKSLLLDYLTGNRQVIDFDLIETQQYYDMHENEEYKKWWQSGKRDDQPKS